MRSHIAHGEHSAIVCFSSSYLDVFKKWFKLIWMIDYSDGEIIPKVGNWADVTNYR